MVEVDSLKKEIVKQEAENERLYKIFQYRLYEEDMQPIISEWRTGSKRVKELIAKLNKTEYSEKIEEHKAENHTFVNGYGEATSREITSTTYSRAEKSLSKQIMSFIS